jgi:hypothetical protein
MWKGKGYDLATIRRISHNFLIPRHRGIKAQFCHSFPWGTKAIAIKYSAIGQCKAGGRLRSEREGHFFTFLWKKFAAI